jgi:hypothetical protein
MKQCTNLKIKVKSLMKTIDSEKSGYVKPELFFELLNLHKIIISDNDKA